MSHFKIKQALINRLLSTSVTGLTVNDIAFENQDFDPTGKALWVQCFYLPQITSSTGKTLASSDEQEGAFQISVYVPNGGKTESYDNAQLQAIDEVMAGFRNTTSTVYNDQTVQILDSSVNGGSSNESWFKRDITINYLAFTTR